MQTTLTRIFIDLECLGKLGNSKLFSAQNQVISKKKKEKKKKVFAKIQCDFSAEIPNSKLFSAQNQVISKKKKKKVFTQGPSRFSSELTQISSQKPDAQLTKGGGHASILLTLLCNFAILATQRGGHGTMVPPLNTPLVSEIWRK